MEKNFLTNIDEVKSSIKAEMQEMQNKFLIMEGNQKNYEEKLKNLKEKNQNCERDLKKNKS